MDYKFTFLENLPILSYFTLNLGHELNSQVGKENIWSKIGLHGIYFHVFTLTYGCIIIQVDIRFT